jgi:EmrB/QacA subfamily drug resistance transporter
VNGLTPIETQNLHASAALPFQYPVAVACLSALLGSLDSSINIGFPAITAAFALEVTAIQWVVVSYVLTHASLLLGCGGLADLSGHRRLLICGLLISAAAFIACGLAPSFDWLIAGRIVQGLGAALIFGTAPALVTLAVPAESRGRVLGIYQMSAAAGYAIGPLLGGMLVDNFGWRATFLFRVAPAALLAGLAIVKLPRQSERKAAARFDFLGALTLAISVAAGLLTLTQARARGGLSPEVIILALASIACFTGFIVAERRAAAPVIDLTLFRKAPFVIANLLALMANCARFAIGLLLPYFVINVLHYSATVGGSLMLATYLLTIIAAPLAGKLSDRIGTARLSSLGLAIEGLGLWLLSRLGQQTDYFSLAFALVIVGLGLGIFEAPNMSFVMGAIPRSQQGIAGAGANMMRPLGIVCGATGWSMLFDHRRTLAGHLTGTLSDGDATVLAFQQVFLAAAMLCGAAWVLSCWRRASGQPAQQSDAL